MRVEICEGLCLKVPFVSRKIYISVIVGVNLLVEVR